MDNIDNGQKMHVTVEWMAEKYEEMNQQLFGGALGACRFKVFTTGRGSQGGTLGWFKITGKGVKVDKYSRWMYIYTQFGKERINEYNFVNYCQPQIEINGNYTATEEGFLATLVHEMCHYYTYMNGRCPGQAHGKEFYAIGNIASSRSNGRFTIQRLATAEEMKEWELSPEMQAKKDKRIANKKSKVNAVFSYNDNGHIELTMTSSQDLIKTITKYTALRSKKENVNKDRGACTELIVSNDPELIDLLFSNGYKKNMRSYRFWYVENQPWINQVKNYEYQVLHRGNMLESKKIEKIVENVINRFLSEELGLVSDENFISINPDMNLGEESPLELA